jgi:hypothetical protein
MSFHNSASCPRKAKARFDTIINTYRELFHDKLPEEKQYWTLAGPCFDEDGELGTCSEIHQLISSGLITESQYHGIDNGIEIIEKNRIAAPNSNFYHGDFISQLQIEAQTGRFNPGIVNCDFTKMVKTSAVDVGNVMYLLDNHNISDTMMVVNFPANNPYSGKLDENTDYEKLIDDFWNELSSNQRFNSSWNERCHIYPECYLYGGTGENSRTTMITFIIYKHD